MLGQMMSFPLTISSVMRHATTVHPRTEIVSVTHDHDRHRYTFHDCFQRAAKLANAFAGESINKGERVGTLAWNDFRHMELYFATPSYGAVCHTINPRLHPDQIRFIINDAQDQLLFIDPMFIPLIVPIQHDIPSVKRIIVLDSGQADRAALSIDNTDYESYIAEQSTHIEWPELDENDACSLCYTSGTTGNPKGVLYSHRAIVLHSMTVAMPDAFCLSRADTLLPVVPMFHVNAWGLPFAAAMQGTKLVFAGAKVAQPDALTDLLNSEKVTLSAGVPTVWQGLQHYLTATNSTLPSVTSMIVGGSACPEYLIEYFQDAQGIQIIHAWGMTELSPLGTINRCKSVEVQSLPADKQRELELKQGYPVFGVELAVEGPDGNDQPWDGKSQGELKARGPWVCSNYFNQEESFDWFYTGDVATIDEFGYMKIVDRIKDVIKSGGEWISSNDIEGFAAAHAEIKQAAVIGIPHPKWGERPLLIAVREEGATISAEALLQSLEGKIAKWWMPDSVIFTDQLPLTATGKISKMTLREAHKNNSLTILD